MSLERVMKSGYRLLSLISYIFLFVGCTKETLYNIKININNININIINEDKEFIEYL